MKANPYFHLACLTAILAPASANLRSVPLQTVTAVDHETGDTMRVELSVARNGDGLMFEAYLTLTSKNVRAEVLAHRARYAVTSREICDRRFAAFDPVEAIFNNIRLDAWRRGLDPSITDTLEFPGDLTKWLRRFQKLVIRCEEEFSRDNGHFKQFAPPISTAPIVPAPPSGFLSPRNRKSSDEVRSVGSALAALPPKTSTAIVPLGYGRLPFKPK